MDKGSRENIVSQPNASRSGIENAPQPVENDRGGTRKKRNPSKYIGKEAQPISILSHLVEV
jgi:hypothetical protein